MTTRKLFNWKKRAANRARARHWQKTGRNEGADFLALAALDDLQLRLSTIERQFERVLILDAPTPDWAKAIAAMIGQKNPSAICTTLDCDQAEEPTTLDVGEQRFDLAISLLGLQDYDALPERLAAIKAVLQPDGLFLACLMGGATLSQLRQTLLAIEPDIFGGIRPRIHPMVEVKDMGGLLQRAGFALPVADTEPYTVHYDDVTALVRDLRAMGATKCLNFDGSEPIRRNFWPLVNAHYQQYFANEKGRLRATFEIIWVSGWAPAAHQPKPLQRGSATHSLKDALKNIEKN